MVQFFVLKFQENKAVGGLVSASGPVFFFTQMGSTFPQRFVLHF